MVGSAPAANPLPRTLHALGSLAAGQKQTTLMAALGNSLEQLGIPFITGARLAGLVRLEDALQIVQH